MNRQSRLSAITMALCGGVVAMAAAGAAEAATVERNFYRNGGSACTGALPTYEGALRKRPKAIANEGTGTAFVTCSALADDANINKPHLAYVFATNRSAAPMILSCTLINGDDVYGSVATPASIALPVNALTILSWTPPVGYAFARDSISVSCALPPGVELNLFGHSVLEGT